MVLIYFPLLNSINAFFSADLLDLGLLGGDDSEDDEDEKDDPLYAVNLGVSSKMIPAIHRR